MNIVNAILAGQVAPLPPIAALGYEYVVAGNGLFVRAEDSRLEALIPVALARLHGLAEVEPFARLTLRVSRVPSAFLWSVLASARRRMPNEAMYQFTHDGVRWHCAMPEQRATATTLEFDDDGLAVVDLHSHNTMPAFFSSGQWQFADDNDERGLRFYAVIGKVDTDRPQIAARVGVYGQHWRVPATAVFDGLGPFVDIFGKDDDGKEEDSESAG